MNQTEDKRVEKVRAEIVAARKDLAKLKTLVKTRRS